MFWDKFMGLCKSRGISPAQFAREVKISNGILTKWKSGSLPGTEALLKISQYFDVSIDYLLIDDDIKSKAEQAVKAHIVSHSTTKPIFNRNNLPDVNEIKYFSIPINIEDQAFETYEYDYEKESPEARRIRESIINTLNDMNEENLKKTQEILSIIRR